jgi:alpha-glucosidase (family GH31 glycosyl hydrolase)
MFRWDGRRWQFAGTTSHDEQVSEFEDTMQEDSVPVQVFSMENP